MVSEGSILCLSHGFAERGLEPPQDQTIGHR